MLAKTVEERIKEIPYEEGGKDLIEEFSKEEPPKLIPICEVCGEHKDETICVEGNLRTATGICPGKTGAEYICLKCGGSNKIRGQGCSLCGCKKLKEEIIISDVIWGVIQEDYLSIEKNNTRELKELRCVFTNDLKKTIHKLYLGEKYLFVGEIKICQDRKAPYYYMEIQFFHHQKNGVEAYIFNPEEISRFKQYSETLDLMSTMKQGIFGNDLARVDDCMEVAILSMIGSPKCFVAGNIMRNRGNIMNLFVGSPGKGKSQILKRTAFFFPRSRYIACTGASGIGLTASVRKDEVLGTYVVDPGAVALCHGGLGGSIAAIDELDKIPKEDLQKLNTQMDSLTIPIDKANIHRTLPADATILAGMNPKYQSFDLNSEEGLYGQINLTKDFIDRFDVVFNFDYFIGEGNEREITEISAKAYYEEADEPVRTNRDFIRRYICYARTINPVCDKACITYITEEFLNLMDKKDKSTTTSQRLFDVLVRLTCGYSRLRLSEKPDYSDVKNAVELIMLGYKSLGMLTSGGHLNTFKVENVPTPKKRNYIEMVKDELEKNGKAPLSETILREAIGLSEREFEPILQGMKSSGDIFFPRSGYVKLL